MEIKIANDTASANGQTCPVVWHQGRAATTIPEAAKLSGLNLYPRRGINSPQYRYSRVLEYFTVGGIYFVYLDTVNDALAMPRKTPKK